MSLNKLIIIFFCFIWPRNNKSCKIVEIALSPRPPLKLLKMLCNTLPQCVFDARIKWNFEKQILYSIFRIEIKGAIFSESAKKLMVIFLESKRTK